MEDTTQQSASSQTQTHGTLFNPTSRLTSDMTDGNLPLGDHQSSVASMVGAIRVKRARDPRAVAHHFTLHTGEVQALFVTPQTGTKEWSDDGPTVEAVR